MSSRDARRFGVLVAVLALAVGASVVLASAAPFGEAVAVGAQSATQVEECTTIDDSGTYVLTSGVENGGQTAISQACIRITADGVTFDGGDHRLDGRGVSHTKGVAVVDAENVTVRNVAVNDWHAGVLVEGGSATVENVRTFSNAYGVRVENATGATVTNGTVEDNLVGVRAGGADLELSGNEFSGNEIDVQDANESAA